MLSGPLGHTGGLLCRRHAQHSMRLANRAQVIRLEECTGDYASFPSVIVANLVLEQPAQTALPETCYLTKQSGSVSKAVHPKRWKPRRRRKQQPRPRVPSLPLRFQLIRPREPVQLRNVDLLRRNAIYAGSPAASATGIARPR